MNKEHFSDVYMMSIPDPIIEHFYDGSVSGRSVKGSVFTLVFLTVFFACIAVLFAA